MNQIENLWARMIAMFGQRWEYSFGDDPHGFAGDTWAAGLSDLSPSQLALGLRECARSLDPKPPSMQQFRAWCLCIPSFATVLHELRPGAPSVSPFVRHMHGLLDSYALRTADDRSARQMIRDAYELTVNHVAQGGALCDASRALMFDTSAERFSYDKKHLENLQKLAQDSGLPFDLGP